MPIPSPEYKIRRKLIKEIKALRRIVKQKERELRIKLQNGAKFDNATTKA